MTVIDNGATLATTGTKVSVRPMTPTIGAMIDGADLRQDLRADDIAVIRRALLDWKVVFFRDQDIDTEQHLAFARRFGELEVHPFAPQKPGFPEVLAITHDADAPGQENVWHSDVTWRLEPSLGSVLRVLECPTIGGDTLFADMCAAYDGLPRRIKERVDGLVARHDFTHFREAMRRRGVSDEKVAAFDQQYPAPEHPVIRTHPETGRKAIYVNAAFTREIVGLDPDESHELLELLYRRATVPEYQVRFHWEPNSIAFWDNRSCQHYAVSDYWPQVRRAERVTVVGDTPFYDADAPTTADEASPFRGVVGRFATS